MDHQKLEKVGAVAGQEVQVAIFSYSVLFIVYNITTSDAMTTRYDSMLRETTGMYLISCLPSERAS